MATPTTPKPAPVPVAIRVPTGTRPATPAAAAPPRAVPVAATPIAGRTTAPTPTASGSPRFWSETTLGMPRWLLALVLAAVAGGYIWYKYGR